MEGKEENLRGMDTEEVAWEEHRQRSIDEAHDNSSTRLYCGRCDTECDYFGINPSKILGFICHHCSEWNEVDSDDSDVSEDDRWLYASNNYATITGNIKEGRVWKLSPIAQKFNGKVIEQFKQDWKANRMFILSKEE